MLERRLADRRGSEGPRVALAALWCGLLLTANNGLHPLRDAMALSGEVERSGTFVDGQDLDRDNVALAAKDKDDRAKVQEAIDRVEEVVAMGLRVKSEDAAAQEPAE